MRRILFVANGHGENAIAARVARELPSLAHEPLGLDLLSIVGTGISNGGLTVVGPRRRLPSGGLVAMGNVRAFARDLGAGFAGLLGAQLAFLRAARNRYDAVVAVGDAYALALALVTGARTVFVGTAKSVYVAPYGPFERTLLRRALRVFVRDEPTAGALRAQRVAAEAPGNAIVDLAGDEPAARAGTWLGILPGSRETAYGDGLRLARVVVALARRRPALGALFSVAPALDVARFERELVTEGWQLFAGEGDVPFEARRGDARLVAWRGSAAALFRASIAVLGQAGTANEQAAAFGLPVVALQARRARDDWYRMRQRRLLGDALLVVPPEPDAAAAAIDALLDDGQRLAAMGAVGRARMGGSGGAHAIARAVLACAQ